MQSPSESLVPAEVPALRAEGEKRVELAKQIKIVGPESYEGAVDELRRVVNLKKQIVAAFERPKKLAFEAHRAITKLEGDLLTFPVGAEAVIKREIGRWEDVERRRREQEQARISEDLRRREEDERLEQAEALSDAGHQEAAEALLDQPIVAPVVEIRHEKPAGISTRGKWTWRALDDSKINRPFLMRDDKKINQTVAAMGPDAVEVVGGIEVLRDTIVAVR